MKESNVLLKRTLVVLLALALVFTFTLGVTSQVEAKDAQSYVSIGASNVNGYGLRGYLVPPAGSGMDENSVMEAASLYKDLKSNANVLGYKQAPRESYPKLVEAALTKQGNPTKLTQLAISSMRAEELRILLDNGYNGDAYSAWRFIGEGKWFDIADGTKDGDFSQLRSEYQNAVKDADIITVDIGVNNFGVYLSYMLTSNFALDNDLSSIDPAIGEQYKAAKAQIKAVLAENGIAAEGYDELIDTLAYALVGFCYNFDKSMERIYELNPDAQVVVVSIQNLMSGLDAQIGDTVVPFGDVLGALINTANTYIAVGSPYASQYLFADVRQDGRVEFFIDKMAAYDGNPENLDKNIIDCFDVWDGSPGEDYDRGFHIKYQVAKLAIANHLTTEANVEKYLEEEGKAMLNKAYDAYAQILSASVNCDAIDLAALTANTNKIEGALSEGIWNAVQTAVTTPGEYTLPADFFSKIADKCDTTESVVKTVAAMAVRTDIGNSFFGHPTPAGHQTVADAILAAIENETTGEDVIANEVKIIEKQLAELVDEYGPAALEAFENHIVAEGVLTEEQLDELEALIAAAVADPEGVADTMIQDAVEYVYNAIEPDLEKVQEMIDYLESIPVEEILAAATHGEYALDKTNYYVALGGDTAFGTGIGKADDGYFDLLAEALGLDADTQFKNLAEKQLSPEAILPYIQKNAAEIAKADLITYQLDGTSFIYAVLSDKNPDWSEYFSEEELGFIKAAIPAVEEVLAANWDEYADKTAAEIVDLIKNEVIANAVAENEYVAEFVSENGDEINAILAQCVAEVQSLADTVEADKDRALDKAAEVKPFAPYAEKLLYATIAYTVNNAKAIEAIEEINPDATLLVVGMYNPLEGLQVKVGGETVDVGEYMGYLIDASDIYNTALAVADGGFTFVPVPDTEIGGFDTVIDLDNMGIGSLGTALMFMNDNMYADADGHEYIYEQIMNALTVIPHTHDMVKTDAKAPSCTEAGNSEYWYCADCEKYFADEAGTTEIEADSWMIPATGHVWDEGKVTLYPTPKAEGVKTFTCTVCKETKTEPIAKLDWKFIDVPEGSYYELPVYWGVYLGIVYGTSDITYSPDQGCTRAQAVTFLWRAAGCPEPQTATCPFTDVKASAYYYKAVLWGTENGIIAGTSKTTFSPNQVCLRCQAVTFLWRFDGKPVVNSANPFTDVKASAYYYNAVLWAAKEGVAAGTSKTTFSPQNACTRAHMITFIYRLCK